MCDFLAGHLAGERVYPGDKGKYYLPITEKTKSLIPDHYLYGEGNGKLLNLHGVRKSRILVVEVILSQGLSLTLWYHSAWSSFKIYGETRKLVDGIFTFNFSYHFCAWIWTFLWSSRPVLLVDQSTDNLIQLILNNPAATELISSIKGDFPVIRYSLRYWTPGWFNY